MATLLILFQCCHPSWRHWNTHTIWVFSTDKINHKHLSQRKEKRQKNKMRTDRWKLWRGGEEEEKEISYIHIAGAKIPDQHNLRKERFSFAHRFWGFQSSATVKAQPVHLWWEHEEQYDRIIVDQKVESSESTRCLVWIFQSPTPWWTTSISHGYLLNVPQVQTSSTRISTQTWTRGDFPLRSEGWLRQTYWFYFIYLDTKYRHTSKCTFNFCNSIRYRICST